VRLCTSSGWNAELGLQAGWTCALLLVTAGMPDSKNPRRYLILVLALTSRLLVAALVYVYRPLGGRAVGAPQAVTALHEVAQANTCPVCGQRSVFTAFGDPPRPLARCRACGSLERHRLLYLYLRQETSLFEDKLSVLHFSPEKGLSAALRAQKNLVYATSWYEPDRAADFHLDLTDLSLPDESWDVMIVYHILEHITEDRKAMREMYRVMKPGGWAVVQVPVRDVPDSLEDPSVVTEKERDEKFGQYDHVRYYGWKDFADRLSDAGFEVKIERFGRELSDDLVREFSLDRDERIYLLRKPAKIEPGAAAGPRPNRISNDTDATPPARRSRPGFPQADVLE
jgi:predicted SAM-dependent methyltransferase/rubredoxin